MSKLLCYNRGCGKEYDEADNGPNACSFHPGEPVFHDAYKSWSCCKKKSIDFTTFLNMPGCTNAPHSNIKPVSTTTTVKPAPVVVAKDPEPPRPKLQRMRRPPADGTMIDIVQELGPSLKNSTAAAIVKPDVENTSCFNTSCSLKYVDRDSSPVCTYHPGEAVFHEGLKYWSCCKKKSMDFDEFMKQKGCTKGEHSWKPKTKVDCRYDWIQTASHVTATIYAKGYDAQTVKTQTNGSKFSVAIDLAVGRFEKEWFLYGVVDVKLSTAVLLGTKVEVKLKKAEPIQWPIFDIALPESGDGSEDEDAGPGPSVDAVDLSDI